MKNYLFFLCLLVIPLFSVCQQVLPTYQTSNWSDLKNLDIPVLTDSVQINIMDYGGDSTGVLKNNIALSKALGYLKTTNKTGIVYFPTGSFLFTITVNLPSNTILKGAGAPATTLRFMMGGKGNLITANGVFNSTISYIIAGGIKNSYKLRISNPSSFNTGDMVKLIETDTDLMYSSWAYQNVGQIMQIKSIVGDSIEFYSALRLNYPASRNPYLVKINTIDNVGISCLKLIRGDNVTDGNQYSNIYFETTSNCWINGVQSDSTFFAHVVLSNSYHTVIKGSYFANSYNYGGDGRGYGIACQASSSENLIENNIFRRLRHAMLLQAGANGNVFAYNYSRETFWVQPPAPSDVSGDIVIHGNYPFSNLFEGNIVQNLEMDNSHANNGPYNLFFRNRAENVGVYMNSGAGDSSAYIGNEVTTTVAQASMYGGGLYGQYTLTGNGNFTFGNNILGVNKPSGTNNLPDVSYYLTNKPSFFTMPWPSIGYPIAINSGTIPAKARFDANILTACTNNNNTVVALDHFLLSGQSSSLSNILNWAVTATNNSVVYKILRSTDGIHFDTIGIVSAIRTTTTTTYQYIDNVTIAMQNSVNTYYQVLGYQNGQISASSNVLVIQNVANDVGINVVIYPNPTSGEVSAIFNYDQDKILGAKLMDQNGKLIALLPIITTINSWNTIRFSLARYSAGIYYLVINISGINKSYPIVKQ